MRTPELASEAWRNVRSGASRALLLMVTTVITFGSLAWLDMSAVQTIQQSAANFHQAGASTYALTAPGLVSGAACDSLRSIPGVQAAGAIRPSAEPIVPSATPQRSIPMFAVTPGFNALLGPTATGAVLAETDVATQYGLRTRPNLATTTGDYPVQGTYDWPDDGRDPTLGYAIAATAQVNAIYDQCWINVWPADTSKRALLYVALTSQATSQDKVTLGQLNPRLGVDPDFDGAYLTRVTRFAPLIAALIGFALCFSVLRLRRLELATSRHLGQTRSEQALQMVLESSIWSAAALALCAGALEVWVHHAHAAPMVGQLGMIVLLAGWLGTALGSVAGAAVIRERQIINFFKAR